MLGEQLPAAWDCRIPSLHTPNPTVPTLKEADSRVEFSKVCLDTGWASVLCSKAKPLNQKINSFHIRFIIPSFIFA